MLQAGRAGAGTGHGGPAHRPRDRRTTAANPSQEPRRINIFTAWQHVWRLPDLQNRGEIRYFIFQPFCDKEWVDGFFTVWHHIVLCWLIDSISLSSNQQIIQLKCMSVLRSINGVALYIHFLMSCWSYCDDYISRSVHATDFDIQWINGLAEIS